MFTIITLAFYIFVIISMCCRDLAEAVHTAMVEAGVFFHEGITVNKIQKLDNGKRG